MKKGFAKIILPVSESAAEIIDREYMETGRITAFETNDNELIIWEKWGGHEKLFSDIKLRFSPREAVCIYVPDQDWNLKWIEGFQPLRAGGYWVTPPWHADKIPEGETAIVINPGSAFGTGTHETTRLSLELMSRHLKKNSKMMDLGCGSGILTVAALKMGAARVFACDNDPGIEDNLRENLALNETECVEINIGDALQMKDLSCDLAVINIQKPVIFPLLQIVGNLDAAKRPSRMILAGLLKKDAGELRTLLSKTGWRIVEMPEEGEWIAAYAVPEENVL